MSAFNEKSENGIYRSRPHPYDPRRSWAAVLFTSEPIPVSPVLYSSIWKTLEQRPVDFSAWWTPLFFEEPPPVSPVYIGRMVGYNVYRREEVYPFDNRQNHNPALFPPEPPGPGGECCECDCPPKIHLYPTHNLGWSF